MFFYVSSIQKLWKFVSINMSFNLFLELSVNLMKRNFFREIRDTILINTLNFSYLNSVKQFLILLLFKVFKR
ncbi:hypothetical protein GvMRE_IIg144 [endosymbiont GvMRE of Glomus versiforme]|nr:hypothetical protein GvMRE_IIg144 [endosymbiont GvMRE of Glomus versiforme]